MCSIIQELQMQFCISKISMAKKKKKKIVGIQVTKNEKYPYLYQQILKCPVFSYITPEKSN